MDIYPPLIKISKKIKIYIGDFQEDYIQYLNMFICIFLGKIIRYTLWLLLNEENYNEYFGKDWNVSYTLNNPYYSIRKIPLIILSGYCAFILQKKIITFYKSCRNYKNLYIGEIEWEKWVVIIKQNYLR